MPRSRIVVAALLCCLGLRAEAAGPKYFYVRSPESGRPILVRTAEAGFTPVATSGTPTNTSTNTPAATSANSSSAAKLDLQQLESRITTLRLAQAIDRIHDHLGLKTASPAAGDGTLPLSLITTGGQSQEGLLMELLARALAGSSPLGSGVPATPTATSAAPASGNAEVQAAHARLQVYQAWKSDVDNRQKMDGVYKAKLKELEDLQTNLAKEREAKLIEINKQIEELKKSLPK